jgi:syntaxin-binding protein 1
LSIAQLTQYIAAVIHEWTYDAMCHDLLDMDGNKYIYETTNGGRRENKEVLLEEHDPIWVELRDLFIADVCTLLIDLSLLIRTSSSTVFSVSM